MQIELMAKHMNKDVDTISRDIERPKYFNPYEAVEYGIIDRVSSCRFGPRTLSFYTCSIIVLFSLLLLTLLHLMGLCVCDC